MIGKRPEVCTVHYAPERHLECQINSCLLHAKEEAKNVLKTIFGPNDVPGPTDFMVTDWINEPCTRGAMVHGTYRALLVRARGRRTITSVPTHPSARGLRIRIEPSCSLMMPSAKYRPRPVPWPTGLLVTNG